MLSVSAWLGGGGSLVLILCVSAALQAVEDASSAGLKYLLLGAIHKCLHHATEAIQVGAGRVGGEGAGLERKEPN